MLHESLLRQRDSPILWCTAVLRRTSRSLQRAADVRVCSCAHTRTRNSALSLSRRRNPRARGALASRCTKWNRSIPLGSPPRQRDGPLPRSKTVLRGASHQPRPPTSSQRSRVRTRECANARSLWGGGAARALAVHAHRAALVAVGPHPTLAHCVSETALSLGARPCSDAPAAASNGEPAFACAHTRTRHRAPFLGRRRRICACGARAPRRAYWSRSIPYESPLRQQHGLSPSVHDCVRRASRGL